MTLFECNSKPSIGNNNIFITLIRFQISIFRIGFFERNRQSIHWKKSKQWPLAGEFVKFEYSPKICQFWRIRVLAKMAILENRSDSIHSPTLASLLCPDSIHSPDIRQPVSPDSIHSPDIRQPFSPDSIHSRKANLATFTRI
jgi:hypothetical protein